MPEASTEIKIPSTLYDIEDVVIAMHWVYDATTKIFGKGEKLYMHEERFKLRAIEGVRYIEAFAMNNILREYPWRGMLGYNGRPRFRLYVDNQTQEPFAQYDDLPRALQALLVADAKVSIEAQWRARFGTEK